MQEQRAEVVQSLAKWKRLRLKEYELEAGLGIVTDMKACVPMMNWDQCILFLLTSGTGRKLWLPINAPWNT